mmetsp:Transcript_95503/g.212429  ORF Transcript_95503/g.212429 Transcript_95503/m.212429 type:complete len:92 (+) Transcript_95503:40-315(+)
MAAHSTGHPHAKAVKCRRDASDVVGEGSRRTSGESSWRGGSTGAPEKATEEVGERGSWLAMAASSAAAAAAVAPTPAAADKPGRTRTEVRR